MHREGKPYLHSATPSFKLASRSPPSKRSPRDSSMKVRTSFAACGVYLSRRNLRISLSSDVTEAIIAIFVEQVLFLRGGGKFSVTISASVIAWQAARVMRRLSRLPSLADIRKVNFVKTRRSGRNKARGDTG
jgi:hypothetical protein